MQTWLLEVNEAKEKLDRLDKVERLVTEMLAPNPGQRATMRRVVGDLFTEQGG